MTVDLSTCLYNIWPANVSLPAGEILIYAQTAGGVGDPAAAERHV